MNIFTILFDLIGLLCNLFIILTATIHRPLRTVTNLLIANTCTAGILFAMADISIVIRVNEFDRLPTGEFPVERDLFCETRTYLVLLASNGVYQSLAVQALSRYFFVIYHKKKQLQTLKVHILMIVVQWVFTMLILAPFFLKKTLVFEYWTLTYVCVFPKSSLLITVYRSLAGLLIPVTLIISIYLAVLRYIRQRGRRQHRRYERDKQRLVRLMILLSLFSAGGIPLALFSLLELTEVLKPAPPYASRLIFFIASITFVCYSITKLVTNRELKQIMNNVLLENRRRFRRINAEQSETKF
ncbi:unnamed protein product [Didymodactylos carnosus]|uniref:G-protein coupled receptors family 1 profile domain-containing protein n=1 Tax=Didymodactylos carnosus TaxID=1234261 RepID=A0A814HB26_9BILA|nr:unnamed protein product [Didymodactylos carnosus]CAF1125575.1 unnamed protein product [Didymodactylos carnosus]CAF3779528.1 unnamed protein product [Didymodactylos carnosus]CAF3903204.1 unnamed protein product [Didymodactylos carnosus]